MKTDTGVEVHFVTLRQVIMHPGGSQQTFMINTNGPVTRSLRMKS
jgi:hypothetical protein